MTKITPAQVGKALAHPLRVSIVEHLLANERASPAEIAREFEEPIGNVSYHVRFLCDGGDPQNVPWSAIRLVSTKPRRGALEHYYTLRPEWARKFKAALSALEAA